MDLPAHLERFVKSRLAVGRSPRTVESYIYHINHFITWCASNGYTDSDLTGTVGAETIEEYLFYLETEELSPFTIHGRYRSLRALYRFIDRRHGPIENGSPFLWLSEPATPDTLPKAIPFADFTLLLHTVRGNDWLIARDRLLIKMLFYTGLRAGELVTLCIDDIDLERRRIRVMRWKTRREEYVPLSRSLGAELSEWLKAKRPDCDHNGLWPTLKQKHVSAPLLYEGLKQMVRRRCRQAGIKEYRPHSFRHGCAVHIIQQGGDISLVKELLGHRDLNTTQIYLRFDLSQLTSAYDRIFD